jgi:hypothetical protein
VEQERSDLALLKGCLGHTKSMRMLTRSSRLAAELKRKWRAVVAAGASNGATAATTTRPEDIVHLYGALKQILEEALKLPGVEDEDFIHLIETDEAVGDPENGLCNGLTDINGLRKDLEEYGIPEQSTNFECG